MIPAILVLLFATLASCQNTNVTLAFMYPGELWDVGRNMPPAFQMALEEINNNSLLLPGITLLGKEIDSRCATGPALAGALDAWLNFSVPVIIGGGCSGATRAVASLAAESAWTIPMISWGAVDPALSDNDVYPTFLRALSPDDLQAFAWHDVAAYYGWDRVGLLHATDNLHTQLASNFIARADEVGTVTDITRDAFLGGSEGIAITNQMEKFQEENLRIMLIACYAGDLTSWVLPEALEFGMIGGDALDEKRVWFLTDGSAYDGFTDNTTYLEAMAGSLGLLTTPGVAESSPNFEDYEVWKAKFEDYLAQLPESFDFEVYATFAYDATYTVAYALHDLLESGNWTTADFQTPPFSTALVTAMKGMNRLSPSGTQLQYDENGNRPLSYNLINFQEVEGMYTWVAVGLWDADIGLSEGGGNRSFTEIDTPIWPAAWEGLQPEATLDGDIDDSLPGYIIGTIVALLVLVLLLIILAVAQGIRLRMKREPQRKEPAWQKVLFTQELLDEIQSQASLFMTLKVKDAKKKLDEWKRGMLNETLWPELALALKEYGVDEKQLAEDYIFVLENENGKLGPAFLQALIVHGLAISSKANLFREDDLLTKSWRVYCRVQALPWLYSWLSEPIYDFMRDRKAGGMELDASRLGEKSMDELYTNGLRLKLAAQQIFTSFLQHVDNIPKPIAEFLHVAYRQSEEKHGRKVGNYTLANFLFLRFVCVAIVTPHDYGLIEEPPSLDARRDLILISKIIQNLANLVQFGEKEGFMQELNDFIDSNIQNMKDFYGRIAKGKGKFAPPKPIQIPDSLAQSCVKRLYYVSLNNPEAFKQSIAKTMGASFDVGTTTAGTQLTTTNTSDSRTQSRRRGLRSKSKVDLPKEEKKGKKGGKKEMAIIKEESSSSSSPSPSPPPKKGGKEGGKGKGGKKAKAPSPSSSPSGSDQSSASTSVSQTAESSDSGSDSS